MVKLFICRWWCFKIRNFWYTGVFKENRSKLAIFCKKKIQLRAQQQWISETWKKWVPVYKGRFPERSWINIKSAMSRFRIYSKLCKHIKINMSLSIKPVTEQALDKVVLTMNIWVSHNAHLSISSDWTNVSLYSKASLTPEKEKFHICFLEQHLNFLMQIFFLYINTETVFWVLIQKNGLSNMSIKQFFVIMLTTLFHIWWAWMGISHSISVNVRFRVFNLVPKVVLYMMYPICDRVHSGIKVTGWISFIGGL